MKNNHTKETPKLVIGASSLSRVIPTELLIEHLTLGLKSEDIVTLMKDDILIYASSLIPSAVGAKKDNNFLANAILKLLKDGWTAIPF